MVITSIGEVERFSEFAFLSGFPPTLLGNHFHMDANLANSTPNDEATEQGETQ